MTRRRDRDEENFRYSAATERATRQWEARHAEEERPMLGLNWVAVLRMAVLCAVGAVVYAFLKQP